LKRVNQILAIVTLIQCLKFEKICLDLLIKRWKIGFLQKFGVVITAKKKIKTVDPRIFGRSKLV